MTVWHCSARIGDWKNQRKNSEWKTVADCCRDSPDIRCCCLVIASIAETMPVHLNIVTSWPMDSSAEAMSSIDRNGYLFPWKLEKKLAIFLMLRHFIEHRFFLVYLLVSNSVGALIVEPKLRFRKLSKRFVKFDDENGEVKSSLSCSPFVLDSLDADADAFRTLALCVLLSPASFESWPLKTVEVVLRFVVFWCKKIQTYDHKPF